MDSVKQRYICLLPPTIGMTLRNCNIKRSIDKLDIRNIKHQINDLIIQYTGFQFRHYFPISVHIVTVGVVENLLPVSVIGMDQCLDSDADKLLQEIQKNIKWTITSKNLYQFIGQMRKSAHSIFMKKHDLTLSQSEFVVMKLWTLSGSLTKQYHTDCSNNNSSRWSLFINALTNGICKLYKAMIINNLYDTQNRIFPLIPMSLYRGTKAFDPNCKIWNNNTILSFTTSVSIATSFARSSQYKQQNKNCILNIVNCKHHLVNGTFIAAPVKWLSMYKFEEEWIVLPCKFTFSVEQNSDKHILGGNIYKLLLTDNTTR